MHTSKMAINEKQADERTGPALLAVGSILGAAAASACCILPLVLFGAGVSGAWIGNLTQLAPYQPYFIATTAVCLGLGYWLVYRSSRRRCADDAACASPVSNRLVLFGLIAATALVAAALAFDFLGPLFLST